MGEEEPVNDMAEIYPESVDLDTCALADQLDLFWGYTSIYEPQSEDDIEIPASVLSRNVAWMLRAYGDPDVEHIGPAEVMRRMASDFRDVLDHISVPDQPEIEPLLDDAIRALFRLRTALEGDKLN